MVKAELIYNPYTVETTIRFNGKAPRINSQVEKYQNLPLQDWVNELPLIFYNEMNGYDFDIEFSGTSMDFDELTRVFAEENVSTDQVRLFLKNLRRSRIDNLQELRSLVKWLDETPNRKFDLRAFKRDYPEIFEEAYVLVIIHGREITVPTFDNLPVSVEMIDQIELLNDTDLTHTPILVYISPENIEHLGKYIDYLERRGDIQPGQIFFMIDKSMNYSSVKRVITDFGILAPQMVETADDIRIRKYIEQYPATDYICNALRTFLEVADRQKNLLEGENRKSIITNEGVHNQIAQLEFIIARLKNALEIFTNRDNLEIPETWKNQETSLIQKVHQWRNKKTVINRTEEAIIQAKEMEVFINMALNDYREKLSDQVLATQSQLFDDFKTWYKVADYSDHYVCPVSITDSAPEIEKVHIVPQLLQMKTEKQSAPKDDIFGMLFKPNGEEGKKQLLETTYYCNQWREYSATVVSRVAETYMDALFAETCNLYRNMAERYIEHIMECIAKETSQKEQVSENLSTDEKLLQADNNWFIEFSDRIKKIEE